MLHLSRSTVIAVVSCLLFSAAHAQRVYTPPEVLKHLSNQCAVCKKQPADSSRLITGNQYDVNYHNSVFSFSNGDLDEAYKYILQAIASVQQQDARLQYAYFIKAKVLYYKHLFTEAEVELTQLMKEQAKDSIIVSNIYASLAEIALEKGEFTKALDHFNTWEQRFLATASYAAARNFYQNKAVCFLHLQKYPEAEAMLLRNVSMTTEKKDTLGMSIASANLANFYYSQYLDAKAIEQFTRSLQLARRAGDLKVLQDAFLNMAVVEENRQNYQKALDYRKQYQSVHDSLFNRDKVWDLAKQERKFAQQLNENKILLLEQDAKLRTAALRSRRLERNILLFASIGILIFAGFIFYAYRAKARANILINAQRQELAELNQMKDRLFSILAHDLRSPVHSLKLNAGRMQDAIAESNTSQIKKFADSMQDTINRTYSLLDNMLHWALNQAKQLLFRPEKLHLASIVEQVCYDFMPIAQIKDIAVTKNVPPGLFVKSDLNTTKIILRNLLDNAIKYTHGGGSVAISARTANKDCCIHVKDTGIGMRKEILESVFADSKNKVQPDAHNNQSTGFGLGLCKLMAEKNHGSIAVESTEGHGTEVSVCLPLNN